jgi:hypothetical protein
MFRVVSLLGLAVLVVAVVAVTNAPRVLSEEPQTTNDDRSDDVANRVPALAAVGVLPFHAPFSLN